MNLLNTGIWYSKIITRATALVMILLYFNLCLKAQPSSLAIGNVGTCDITTVVVPITGYNLTNIGAITLYIQYDDQSLSFNSLENIDPQLSSIMVNTLSQPARISVVWSKTSGATFVNAPLFSLKFNILNQPGNLAFIKEVCEIANISIPPQIVPVEYTDGTVFSSIPLISSEPANITVPSQYNAVFQVASPNATGFSWQESRTNGTTWTSISDNNSYAGTQTNQLTINQVPSNYNYFLYRCVLSLNSCTTKSSSAVLKVDSVAGIPGFGLNNILHILNSPNPFSDKTTIEYMVPEKGMVTIRIISVTGEIVGTVIDRFQLAGTYTHADNFLYLPAGAYFCHYQFKGTKAINAKYCKMIKN